MSSVLSKIEGGYVYDPANGVDGQVKDLWIQDGRIVDAPAPEVRPDRTLNVAGTVIMPGGVDMHCHIAGPKVNTARKMIPEDKRTADPVVRTRLTRSGTVGSVPSTFATGYLYAGMGYTTAMDAAVPPLGARHAHEELEDTPIIDKGFYVLMGNNHYVMKQLAADEPGLLKAYIAWLLHSTKGFAAKLVNPGGVEIWKSGGGNARGIDDTVEHFGVTPRQIIRGVAAAVDELGLPHPVHIHCNNLGMPGNHATTMETMTSLEGHRAHITHIQFHSYDGDPDGDTVINGDEEFYGTDPQNPDTDGDSLSDGVETNFGFYVDENDTGTDPLNPDTDGDGLGDEVEIPTLPFIDANQPGTDPTIADSDFDNYPDGFEIEQGSDPTLFDSIPQKPALQLLAWWDFDDIGDPANALDSAAGHTGALLGGAAYTADAGGRTATAGDYGMDFGTTNGGQTVHVADANFLNEASVFDEITISFWQKLSGTSNSSSFWAVAPSSGGNSRGIQAHTPWGNGTVYFDSAGCCDPTQRIAGNPGIDYTTWHHFAFVKKGPEKGIWIDGSLFLSGGGAAPLPIDFTELYLGSEFGNNSLQGVMDDFAVFNCALGETEIALLAAGASPPEVVNPVSGVGALTDVGYDPNTQQATITWDSAPGKEYTIYTSTDLQGDPATTWTELTDNWPLGGATGSSTSYTDTISAPGPMRFYKVFENP